MWVTWTLFASMFQMLFDIGTKQKVHSSLINEKKKEVSDANPDMNLRM